MLDSTKNPTNSLKSMNQLLDVSKLVLTSLPLYK